MPMVTTIRAERPFRRTGGIEDLELLADLPAFQVCRNLRFLVLGEQVRVQLLQSLVIAGQLGQLGFARRYGLDARLITRCELAQPLFALG